LKEEKLVKDAILEVDVEDETKTNVSFSKK
jgi:hypothetical protein